MARLIGKRSPRLEGCGPESLTLAQVGRAAHQASAPVVYGRRAQRRRAAAFINYRQLLGYRLPLVTQAAEQSNLHRRPR